MKTINVRARALRPDHLPVIDGTVAELVSADRMGDQMCLRWVPRDADLDSAMVGVDVIRDAVYGLDTLVPCVRRAEVPT